jgi:class 3 adenylate cyclase
LWAMDERPVTRYAKAPDGVSIAYQITGDGPVDVLFITGQANPLDLLWEEPSFARFARRLGGFSRTVWVEIRGAGASGGDLVPWSIASREQDVTAVLDTTGCDPVVLIGSSHAGVEAIHYSSEHPDRVTALVLINTFAHYVRHDDYPFGLPPEAIERYVAGSRETWGTGETVDMLAPSRSGDDRFRAWYARCERLGASPEQLAEGNRAAYRGDVRDLLSTLTVPALVLHREANAYIRVGAGRYLAENIPGAKFVELPGADHLFFVGDTDVLVDEIEEFLTGSHQGAEGDVVTATILFTDVVASTEQSARIGHRKWSSLTDQHDAMVRASLARHRGREIKTMGDGFLATFDASSRAVRAATEIVAAAKGIGLEVRAGVHNGEIEVRPDDVVGLAVSIAKRICDLAGAGEVFVSEAVKIHLVGSGFAYSERGTRTLKGVPDEWRLFAVGS